MLILTRKIRQSIIIADNIEITVVEISGGKVRFSVDAPKDIAVDRKEVREGRRDSANGEVA